MPTGIYKHKKNTGHWLGKKRPDISGENNYAWKGDDASYRSKHNWIENHYGKPTTCEHCQKTNLSGHNIQWANISGKYLRIRTDWLRLCAKCHAVFDKKRYAKRL